MVITPVSDDFFMGIGCSSQVQADQYCIEKFKDDHLEISDSHSEALSSPELSDENLHGLGLPKFKLLFLKTESPLDSAGAPFLNCILKAVKSERWGNQRAHFVFFLSLRNHYLPLLDVQCVEDISLINFTFFSFERCRDFFIFNGEE